jgi:molecular chaperone GrpE
MDNKKTKDQAESTPGTEEQKNEQSTNIDTGPDQSKATQELEDEILSLKDQVLRKAAEFENLRRRTREEREQLILHANEGLIRDLLPVLDDFDRSLAAGGAQEVPESFLSGMELVRAKLFRTLEQRGLKVMESIGTEFDVDVHDAIAQLPSADQPAGTVLDEIQRGYLLHDRVIRHAKVVVAAANDSACNSGQS